jgi:hypothetical protein
MTKVLMTENPPRPTPLPIGKREEVRDVWIFEFGSLGSYNVESENFLLTFFAPSSFPSPRWGEGGGEGKFQIFLARIYLGFGIRRLEFSLLR